MIYKWKEGEQAMDSGNLFAYMGWNNIGRDKLQKLA